MRACCTVVIFFVAMLVVAPTADAQFVFGVRPGTSLQSARFGLAMGRITPYVGLDVMAMGVEANYTETENYRDYWSGDMYRSEERIDLSGSATLLIPHLGARLYLGSVSGTGKNRGGRGTQSSLRPYLFAGVSRALAFVSVSGEEVWREYGPDGSLIDEDTDNFELDKEEEDAIKDLLGIWLFGFGFGAEYPFSDRFSIGGEYELRMFLTSASYSQSDSDDWDDDGIADWREEWKQELSATVKMSSASVSLNFHF